MASFAKRHVDEFNTQDLAKTAWAFVLAGQLDIFFETHLFMALATLTELQVDKLLYMTFFISFPPPRILQCWSASYATSDRNF